MRERWPWALVATGALACTVPDLDDANVIGGEIDQSRFTSVGFVTGPQPGYCTATYVNLPRDECMVLTNAHCPKAGAYKYVYLPLGAGSTLRRYSVRSWAVHPGHGTDYENFQLRSRVLADHIATYAPGELPTWVADSLLDTGEWLVTTAYTIPTEDDIDAPDLEADSAGIYETWRSPDIAILTLDECPTAISPAGVEVGWSVTPGEAIEIAGYGRTSSFEDSRPPSAQQPPSGLPPEPPEEPVFEEVVEYARRAGENTVLAVYADPTVDAQQVRIDTPSTRNFALEAADPELDGRATGTAGDSGAPIFNSNGAIIGIHVSSLSVVPYSWLPFPLDQQRALKWRASYEIALSAFADFVLEPSVCDLGDTEPCGQAGEGKVHHCVAADARSDHVDGQPLQPGDDHMWSIECTLP